MSVTETEYIRNTTKYIVLAQTENVDIVLDNGKILKLSCTISDEDDLPLRETAAGKFFLEHAGQNNDAWDEVEKAINESREYDRLHPQERDW